MDGHWCAPSALAILTDVESASMSGLFDVWMPRAMGALVARQKAKKTKAAKGRSRARRAEVQALRSAGSDSSMDESLIEALPKIDALQDVPSFGDMRVDQSQADAFQAFVDELCAAGEDAMASAMRMGVVVRLDRGFPLVATEGLTLRAEHAVAFAKGADMLPAVGDVVAVRCDPGHDMGVIERVLPRRTTFERWRGKNRGERQVLAANVDIIFIVQPLGAARDSIKLMCDRISRSLVLVNDCGATPVVVLTKADRCDADELADAVRHIENLVGEGIRVLVTSSADGRGLDEVRACIPKGTCGMILGESGAGKSTMLNALLGHDALATSGVRERDDMGRHTTVARVMVALPDPCGVIADAPGLRSLPLVGHERGLARTFPEVVDAARACRFNDCTHTHEPGCAVLEAVEAEEINRARVDAFLALAGEMRVSAQSLDPDIHL